MSKKKLNFFLVFSFTLWRTSLSNALSEKTFSETNDLISNNWESLLSCDLILFLCFLGWTLYLWIFPIRVWAFWQKMFSFFSQEKSESRLKTYKPSLLSVETHSRALNLDKEHCEKKSFRWMRLEEIK